MTWDLYYHFWYAWLMFLRDQMGPSTSLPPGCIAVSDSAKNILNKTYSYMSCTQQNLSQTHSHFLQLNLGRTPALAPAGSGDTIPNNKNNKHVAISNSYLSAPCLAKSQGSFTASAHARSILSFSVPGLCNCSMTYIYLQGLTFYYSSFNSRSAVRTSLSLFMLDYNIYVLTRCILFSTFK